MTELTSARLWLALPLVASSLLLAACVGSPTYGTDKSASEQLASDVTGILSIGPKRREPIDYKPRPELVKPSAAATAQLPPPQDSVAANASPNWPESPEQKRARLRAEATANQDDPSYRSPIVSDVALAAEPSAKRKELGAAERGEDSGVNTRIKPAQREEFNRRLGETKQGSSTTRKYLSEPPIAYRQPAPTAPVGDVGEDEWKKERRAKAASKNSDWSLRQLIPGL